MWVLAKSGGPYDASGELIAVGDQITQVTRSGEHRCLAGLFQSTFNFSPRVGWPDDRSP